MNGQVQLTEREWRRLETGEVAGELLERLVELRRQHGRPTRHCGECRRYLGLASAVRARIERRLAA